MAPGNKRDIFKDVTFYDSNALSEVHRSILLSGGAKEEGGKDGIVDWERVTHLFTLHLDFPEKQDALKRKNIAIITVRIIF